MFRKLLKLNRIRILLVALFIGALLPFYLPATPVFALTTEILKPTVYTLGSGSSVTNPTYAYDFTYGGESTTCANMSVGGNNDQPTITYRTWQTSSNTHSARRLYIRRSGAGNSNDYFRIQYTTTGGNPWTTIETVYNSDIGNTPVVNIGTGVNLANLRVRINTYRVFGSDGGRACIWDVWLECDFTGVPKVGTNIGPAYPITVSPSPMTPQQQWTNVIVPVAHAENLSHIDSVNIKLFFDGAGNDPAQSGFSANAQTCAVFTWTRDGAPEWDIGLSGTTWAINTANCSKPSDSLLQGNWVFSFQIGKVATCSTTNASDWDIYAIAVDYNSANSTNYLRDVEMNWYGEVSVTTVDVAWEGITPGSDFSNDTKQTDISVTYIANGVYYQKAASTTNWTSARGNAALNAGGTPGNWQFSLKAYDTDNLMAAVLVNVYPTFVTFGSGGQTSESGEAISTNTLWLKLGATIPEATFSGTIFYLISSTS